MRRRQSNARSISSDDLSSDYTTSDDSDSSEDSELLALVDGGCKKNPFTVPRIIVQPNSPIPGKAAGSGGVTPRGTLSPGEDSSDPNYIAQAVPLGPTPYGTALYQPSLSSLTKYQYKTPSLPSTSAAPAAPQYRTLSGVLSNNLKKNWAAGPEANTDRPQRKVDQTEIDARLKSLMDRLSSQQSLLKPADKPSVQMQHYLDQVSSHPSPNIHLVPLTHLCNGPLQSSKPTPERKMSAPITPYRPTVLPSAASIRKQKEEKELGSEVKVEEDGISIAVPEKVPKAQAEDQSETADSESDSDSESVTTEVSDCEQNNVEHVLPEIKINLAEAEEEPDIEESETNTCDKSFGDDLDFIDDEDNSVEEKANISDDKDPGGASAQVVNEEKKRSPARRRPSLLKTVVSIKSDQPVTVVNYTETLDAEAESLTENPKQLEPSSPKEEPLNASLAEMEESFQTTEGGLDSSRDVFESFNNTMDESVSLADGSLESTGETSTEIECLNSVVANDEPKEIVRMQESVTTGSEESDSGQVILAQKEESQQEVDNDCMVEENRTVEDECGNLVIVDNHGLPQTLGENETSTDVIEKEDTNEHQPQDNITDIYRVTNANEKIDRLANHQQHNSNMIHDLIIGRSKQRR